MTSYFCCAHVGVPTVLIAMLRMLLGVTEFRLLRPYPQHWFSVSGTHMAGIYCESVTTIWQELLLVPCMYSVDYSCCSLTARHVVRVGAASGRTDQTVMVTISLH